ncbi:MAG: glycosyltransferase family 2 protein [Actinobacteria bacterium]|nr:MAG: glycosyltransferase family 2 protein [Actinomycetota bacterium]
MISVCVPVHELRGAERLVRLQDALSAGLAGTDGELVVALNGVPESVAPQGVRAVRLPENLGVGPGWNAAADVARGEILVFGNDDVIPGPRSLALLAGVLESVEQAGIVGVDSWDAKQDAPRADSSETPRECRAVRGPLLAVRKDTFEGVGGFDEDYAPCCWEEVDLSLAIRKKLGLRSYVLHVDFHHQPRISARRALPWVRVAYAGRSESLRSIRRRNRQRLAEKWGV